MVGSENFSPENPYWWAQQLRRPSNMRAREFVWFCQKMAEQHGGPLAGQMPAPRANPHRDEIMRDLDRQLKSLEAKVNYRQYETDDGVEALRLMKNWNKYGPAKLAKVEGYFSEDEKEEVKRLLAEANSYGYNTSWPTVRTEKPEEPEDLSWIPPMPGEAP